MHAMTLIGMVLIDVKRRVAGKAYTAAFLPVRDTRHDFCHDSVRLRTVIRLT